MIAIVVNQSDFFFFGFHNNFQFNIKIFKLAIFDINNFQIGKLEII